MSDLVHDEARNFAPQVLLIDAGAEFNNCAGDSQAYSDLRCFHINLHPFYSLALCPLETAVNLHPRPGLSALVLKMHNVHPPPRNQPRS